MNQSVKIVPASGNRDIALEKRYKKLNQLGFVRGDTALDQWHILVTEAWNASKLPENEFVRDYLVTMLNRFTGRSNLFELLTAFDYCRHLLGERRVDGPCVQDVADISLQYVAFFPERSNYLHEPRSLGYSEEVGVGLYRQLAKESVGLDDWFSQAYQEMANSFGRAALVLRSVCPRFVQQASILRESFARAQTISTDYEASRDVRSVINFGHLFCQQPTNVISTRN